MKNSLIYKLTLLVFAVTFVTSCVQDDDFETPDLQVVQPVLESDPITLGALYSLFDQAARDEANDLGVDPNDEDVLNEIKADLQVTFEEGTTYVEGYVISSDEGGNFFEELILQDAPSNPTTGIKVLIDVSPLSTTYELGRKVYVRLDGLSIGLSNGVFTVGVKNTNNLDKIAESLLTETLLRSAEVATLEPLPITIADFAADKTNLYISLADMQFNRNEVLGENAKTFAAESGDQFDGERFLESCESGASAIFSTSTFADFKAVLLPKGRGTFNGILTYNFFGDIFNLVVNEPGDFDFNNEERCDPDVFGCTGASGGGAEFYSENFEAFNAIEDYVDAGWTNANVVTSNGEVWEIGNFSNNNYAQISGFSSNEDDIQTWLVTPAINMDNTTGEEFLFDLQVNFDNGTILSVLVSDDFTGDPTTATWNLLDASIPTGPEGGFGDFETIGPINVSCVDGNVNFAFRYLGSDPNATTRYHVDNVRLTGN